MVDNGSFNPGNIVVNELNHVDERVRDIVPLERNTPLPQGWVPGNWSIICGRGKECYDHIGNRRFRILCDIHFAKYANKQTSKHEKTQIVVSIMDAFREGSNNVGGFVKYDANSERWVEVGDEMAREKIGQQFRSMIKKKHKQDYLARKRQKSQQQQQQQQQGRINARNSIVKTSYSASTTKIESNKVSTIDNDTTAIISDDEFEPLPWDFQSSCVYAA